VQSEVEKAFAKERELGSTVLLPITIDDAVRDTRQAWAAEIRNTRHIGDFRVWTEPERYKTAFDALLRAFRRE
jgi:hypothetical protein